MRKAFTLAAAVLLCGTLVSAQDFQKVTSLAKQANEELVGGNAQAAISNFKAAIAGAASCTEDGVADLVANCKKGIALANNSLANTMIEGGQLEEAIKQLEETMAAAVEAGDEELAQKVDQKTTQLHQALANAKIKAAARERGEISVSRAVHEQRRAPGAAPRLRFGHHRLEVASGRITIGGDDGRMIGELPPRLGAQVLENELHVLRLVDVPVVPRLREPFVPRAPGLKPPRDLLREIAASEVVDARDHPDRPESAQRAVRLEKPHPLAHPRGGDRRRNARGTASGDDQVGVLLQRQRLERLDEPLAPRQARVQHATRRGKRTENETLTRNAPGNYMALVGGPHEFHAQRT